MNRLSLSSLLRSGFRAADLAMSGPGRVPRRLLVGAGGALVLWAILRTVLPQAAAVIAREEHVQLSERDSLRVLELLENPPAAPARLVRAAKAGFTLK